MASWLNHVTIGAARNGTSTHSVDPSSATGVVHGTQFTPTAGRLLICVAEAPVTSTTPAGWTLPSGGAAVNFTGLYVWWLDAAGGDTFSTTHNESNHPCVFDFYEFDAGTTFVQAAAATGLSSGAASPSLSGLTGINHLCATRGIGTTGAGGTLTFDSGTEVVNTSAVGGATDGYTYCLTEIAESGLGDWSPAAIIGGVDVYSSAEGLIFAAAVESSPDEGQNVLWRARVYVA